MRGKILAGFVPGVSPPPDNLQPKKYIATEYRTRYRLFQAYICAKTIDERAGVSWSI
jgi:hypothetical protein